MSIKKVPKARRVFEGRVCRFFELTTAAERRAIQSSGGEEFLLYDDKRGTDLFEYGDIRLLYNWGARNGYRFSVREERPGERLYRVWVSWSPGRYDGRKDSKKRRERHEKENKDREYGVVDIERSLGPGVLETRYGPVESIPAGTPAESLDKSLVE